MLERQTDGAVGYDAYVRAVVSEEWDEKVPYMWKALFDFKHMPKDKEIARHVRRIKNEQGKSELVYVVYPGERIRVGFGVVFALPFPMGAIPLVRSKMSNDWGQYVVFNLFDSDFRGELAAMINNHTEEEIVLRYHMRIAQFIILPLQTPEFTLVNTWEDLPPTDRGTKGLGSTGRF